MVIDWTAERIRTLRKDVCCETQEQFAVRFRLHPEAIRTWEQGRGGPTGPSTVLLDQLAAEYGFDPSAKRNGHASRKLVGAK